MPKERVSNKEEDDRKLYAFLAAFLSIVGFVIALVAKKNDKYVMYYAKQSLVIFIVGAVAGIIGKILIFIPIIGGIIHAALTIIIVLAWILSWLHALSGKMKSIPIISDWTKKIKL